MSAVIPISSCTSGLHFADRRPCTSETIPAIADCINGVCPKLVSCAVPSPESATPQLNSMLVSVLSGWQAFAANTQLLLCISESNSPSSCAPNLFTPLQTVAIRLVPPKLPNTPGIRTGLTKNVVPPKKKTSANSVFTLGVPTELVTAWCWFKVASYLFAFSVTFTIPRVSLGEGSLARNVFQETAIRKPITGGAFSPVCRVPFWSYARFSWQVWIFGPVEALNVFLHDSARLSMFFPNA